MASTNRKRVTALIVDDDRDTRELYTLYLSRFGVNTVEAEDGFHGLAKAASIVPDVITTDLILPRMDGAELCRSLKSAERTRQIPIIVVTGSVEASEVNAVKEAGCISVLTKPCPPDVLLAEIRRVLALPQFAQARVTEPSDILPTPKAYQPCLEAAMTTLQTDANHSPVLHSTNNSPHFRRRITVGSHPVSRRCR